MRSERNALPVVVASEFNISPTSYMHRAMTVLLMTSSEAASFGDSASAIQGTAAAAAVNAVVVAATVAFIVGVHTY